MSRNGRSYVNDERAVYGDEDKKQLLKEWGEALDEEDKETRCICGCALEEAFVEAGGEFCCQSCEDDAEKGREKAEEEDKEEEEQYHKMCENDCCTMLTKDTPIMCYKTDKKEMTLCSTCYWEAGFGKMMRTQTMRMKLRNTNWRRKRARRNFAGAKWESKNVIVINVVGVVVMNV